MSSAPAFDEAQFSAALERLIRSRDLSLLLPLLLGFASLSPADYDGPTSNPSHERTVLINPFTQRMIVIDGTSDLEALIRESAAKSGQPPASKASIEALPVVEIGDDSGECSICLEDWETDRPVKEMPCSHRFHGNCIEKWLGIHGSCPVCRYKMPVDKEEAEQRNEAEGGSERRRIWVSFTFGRDRRSQSDANQTPSSDSADMDSSSPALDQQYGGLD